MTSRPEIPIRHGFYQVPEADHQDFALYNKPPAIVDHDISIFGHGGGVGAVAFSPDGKLLTSASGGKTIGLWDAATGVPLQTLEGHSDEVSGVAFSSDSKMLARVKIRPGRTGKLRITSALSSDCD
jgi:WD40 repeat protein